MKYKHLFLSVIFCLFYSQLNFAQLNPKPKPKPKLWDKMYVGGNLGLQFGTITDIEVSPHVGYYIYPRWSAGVGISYKYRNQKAFSNYSFYYPSYKTNIYGYNIFTTLTLIKDLGKTLGVGNGISIIGHVQYESLSLEKKYFKVSSTDTEGRFWVNSFLVGGGIRQMMGQRSSTYILVLWDLNETIESLYASPIFKFGFDF